MLLPTSEAVHGVGGHLKCWVTTAVQLSNSVMLGPCQNLPQICKETCQESENKLAHAPLLLDSHNTMQNGIALILLEPHCTQFGVLGVNAGRPTYPDISNVI